MGDQPKDGEQRDREKDRYPGHPRPTGPPESKEEESGEDDAGHLGLWKREQLSAAFRL